MPCVDANSKLSASPKLTSHFALRPWIQEMPDIHINEFTKTSQVSCLLFGDHFNPPPGQRETVIEEAKEYGFTTVYRCRDTIVMQNTKNAEKCMICTPRCNY